MAKILVIDDSHDIREMMMIALHMFGYEAEDLADTGQLRSTILQFDPQLVLLDVRFGDKYNQVCKFVKDMRPDLPVILMSADEEISIDYENCYADDFIAKPFDLEKLRNKIEQSLAHQYKYGVVN